jgi:hypothetical protein
MIGTIRKSFCSPFSYLVHSLSVGQKGDGRIILNVVVSRCDFDIFCQTEEQVVAGDGESVEHEEKIRKENGKALRRKLKEESYGKGVKTKADVVAETHLQGATAGNEPQQMSLRLFRI